MCFYTVNLNRCPNCREVNTFITSTYHAHDGISVNFMFEPLCPAGELRPATDIWLLSDLPQVKCGACIMPEMENGIGELANITDSAPHQNIAANAASAGGASLGSQSPSQVGTNTGMPTPQQTPVNGSFQKNSQQNMINSIPQLHLPVEQSQNQVPAVSNQEPDSFETGFADVLWYTG